MEGMNSGIDRGTIRFRLDGETIELRDVDPTRTVLQFLREDLGKTGTKEGCAEGDCGACTVALVDLDRSGSRLRTRAINSCIQFLPTLDGRELITVEGLRNADGELHPVQQAMVDCHGSQCGFCTPGFVMSLFVQFKNSGQLTRREIDDALAGNLCRCTGYQPIINAAIKMYDLEASGSEDWLQQANTRDATSGKDEDHRVAELRNLQGQSSLQLEFGNRQFCAPRTVDELAAKFEERPDAILLAGGTDIGLWVTKQHRDLPSVIYTGRVAGLSDVAVVDDSIEIGAAVTLTDCMPILTEYFPDLRDLLVRFASPPIRNAGTLGGNVANGSPIGDSMPALLALGAELVLRKGSRNRVLPLNEFYIGYQENALESSEFIERIRIPKARDDARIRSYKVSKRFDQDISAVCGAYCLHLDGTTVSSIKIAYGGLAAIPKRAPAAEHALIGQEWSEEAVNAAIDLLGEDFQPISDMRATSGYRLEVCRNLLYRFWLETTNDKIATDVYGYGR